MKSSYAHLGMRVSNQEGNKHLDHRMLHAMCYHGHKGMVAELHNSVKSSMMVLGISM